MNDELVNIIQPQSFKALLNGFKNVFSGQSAFGCGSPHGHGHFSGQDKFITRIDFRKELTHNFLGRTKTVNVRAIKIGEAPCFGGLENWSRRVNIKGPVSLVATTWDTKIHGPETKLRNTEASARAKLNLF